MVTTRSVSELLPNGQAKINRLIITGAICLLCLAVIPSESKRTKTLQRRFSLKPTQKYLLAAEASAKQDRRNSIILRTMLGLVFTFDVFAIWRVLRTEGDNGGQSPVSVYRPVAKLVLGTLKYFGAFLLGILAALLLTGSAENLAEGLTGFDEIAAVVFYVIPGLYAFFTFLILEFPDLFIQAWWASLILLIPFVCEALALLQRPSTLDPWRPVWIGFPVGFLGTTGICWQALSSL